MGVKKRRSNKESAHSRASLLKTMPPSLSPDPWACSDLQDQRVGMESVMWFIGLPGAGVGAGSLGRED